MKIILLISVIIFLGTSCSKQDPYSRPQSGGTGTTSSGSGGAGGGGGIGTGGGTGTSINVAPFPQGVLVGSLSSARADMASAICNNKFLFAGGYSDQYVALKDVDIFDPVTNTIQSAELSIARNSITGIANGSKAFFAGGCGNGWLNPVSRIDIYDAITYTRSIAELSVARHHMSVAAIGDKVFLPVVLPITRLLHHGLTFTILQLTTGQLQNLANPGRFCCGSYR